MISRVEARLPGIVVAVIGVLFCIGALSYGVVRDGRMGPGLMPMAAGLGLVVLGCLIAVTARPSGRAVTAGSDGERRDVPGGGAAVVGPTEGEAAEENVAHGAQLPPQEVHHPARPWLILGATASALLAAPLVGLIPALGFMSFVLLRFVERESWRVTAIVTVSQVVGAWFLFEEVLDVNLPWGVFGSLV